MLQAAPKNKKCAVSIRYYDSFTYNLVHLVEKIPHGTTVFQNTRYIGNMKDYDTIILSPGPFLPARGLLLHCKSYARRNQFSVFVLAPGGARHSEEARDP